MECRHCSPCHWLVRWQEVPPGYILSKEKRAMFLQGKWSKRSQWWASSWYWVCLCFCWFQRINLTKGRVSPFSVGHWCDHGSSTGSVLSSGTVWLMQAGNWLWDIQGYCQRSYILRLLCKMFQTDVEEPLFGWRLFKLLDWVELKAGSRGWRRRFICRVKVELRLVLLLKTGNINCVGRMEL